MNSAVTENARISVGTRDRLREMSKYYGCYSQDLSGLCVTLFIEEHLEVSKAITIERLKNCRPFISQNIAARLGDGLVKDSYQLGLIVETGFDYLLQNPNCIEQLKVLSSPTRGVIVEIPDSLQLPPHNVARFITSNLLRSTGVVATRAPVSSRHVSVVLKKEDLCRLRSYLPINAGLGWLLAPPDLGLTILAVRTCSKTGGMVHDMRWDSEPVKVLLPRVKDQKKMQLELVRYLTTL